MNLDDALRKACKQLKVPQSYVDMGLQNEKTRERLVKHLLEQRKWQMKGWDDETIELLLRKLSSMDSNNYVQTAGVGEREGRVFSDLVKRRHYGFSHGIGRSGNISEAQPKAAGSSLLSSLTNSIVTDFMRKQISKDIVPSFVLPMATGMSVTLALLTMKQLKPEAKYVLWSRIDQKSCFKSILTAGLTPVVIDTIGDSYLRTDVEAIRAAVTHYKPENILCIISTTSCFAPRAPDDITSISGICKIQNLFHIINNAYGIQSRSICKIIRQAGSYGRVDVVIQSTDKNLMVPVGGTIVSGFASSVIEEMQKNYPGRASISQSVDVLITLLSMGENTYKELVSSREEVFRYLKMKLGLTAAKFGERVVIADKNDVSLALTLNHLNKKSANPNDKDSNKKAVTELGSMLFRRNVNGARVVNQGEVLTVGNHRFENWGTSCTYYAGAYLTAASAIGIKKSDVDFFIRKLDDSLARIKRSNEQNQNQMNDSLSDILSSDDEITPSCSSESFEEVPEIMETEQVSENEADPIDDGQFVRFFETGDGAMTVKTMQICNLADLEPK